MWAHILNGDIIQNSFFPLKKLLVFMRTIKNKSTEYSLQQTVTFFFFFFEHTSSSWCHANTQSDCAPATDLDLPPTLGYWVEGQSG